MSFQPEESLDKYVSGIGVSERTSPVSVVYQGLMHIFYHGSGRDGIWLITFDGNDWTKPAQVLSEDMNVAPNTSPSAVVFQEKLYLFWNQKNDDPAKTEIVWNLRTVCSVLMDTWSTPFSVSEKVNSLLSLQDTSPAAVAHNSKLWIFTNGYKNDGIHYANYDGENWTERAHLNNQSELAIGDGTSPVATSFGGRLHVFWNGRGADGTYTCYRDEKGWRFEDSSIAVRIGGQGFFPGTSPSILNFGNDHGFYLFWHGSGKDGAFYSFTPDGVKWTKQVSMAQQIGGQELRDQTSVCATLFGSVGYVFWVGSNGASIWFCTTKQFDLDTINPADILNALSQRKSFSICAQRAEAKDAADLLKALYDGDIRLPSGTVDSEQSSTVRTIFRPQMEPSQYSGHHLLLSATLAMSVLLGYTSWSEVAGKRLGFAVRRLPNMATGLED